MPPHGPLPIRELLSSALRLREPAGLLYNLGLFAIVAAYVVAGLPLSQDMLSLDLLPSVCIGAILANVADCAEYPIDIFVQLSGFREQWLRWVIFLLGLAFASVITRFIAKIRFVPLASYPPVSHSQLARISHRSRATGARDIGFRFWMR